MYTNCDLGAQCTERPTVYQDKVILSLSLEEGYSEKGFLW